ncbi:hypothetical protein JXL83_05860 [candidate division WOR-3 bacterium]|nr:hypothetical protein [candidate division WOR-3 bacterium]
MSNKTVLILFMFGLALSSCAPKNPEIVSRAVEFARVELEIWRNRMPTIPPTEHKVVCIFTVNIDQESVFEEARLKAGMIKNAKGENLSSVSFDSALIITSKREEGSIDVRAEVDFPEKVTDGEQVIGWLMFFVDGVLIEIETPVAVVKTVY